MSNLRERRGDGDRGGGDGGGCVSLSTLSAVTTAFVDSQPLGMPIMEIAGGDERLLDDSWRLEIAKSTAGVPLVTPGATK